MTFAIMPECNQGTSCMLRKHSNNGVTPMPVLHFLGIMQTASSPHFLMAWLCFSPHPLLLQCLYFSQQGTSVCFKKVFSDSVFLRTTHILLPESQTYFLLGPRKHKIQHLCSCVCWTGRKNPQKSGAKMNPFATQNSLFNMSFETWKKEYDIQESTKWWHIWQWDWF